MHCGRRAQQVICIWRKIFLQAPTSVFPHDQQCIVGDARDILQLITSVFVQDEQCTVDNAYNK